MDRQKFIPPASQKTFALDDTGTVTALKQILLLEDEAEFANALKEYLQAFNYSVTIVSDGVQGLKKVMEKDYDIIICDLLMPNLPGDMFYTAVQRVKPHLSKRFIFITGHHRDSKFADFLKTTKALSLFKPFDMHVLLETILLALKGTRPA